MKKKGLFIALLFLLTAIVTVSMAGLQSCDLAQASDESLTRVPAQTSDRDQTAKDSSATPTVSESSDVLQTMDPPETDPQTTSGDPPATEAISSEETAASSAVPTAVPETSESSAPQTTEPPVTENPTTSEELGFVLDLSEYEKYMNPTGDDWSDEYLLLLNADHPVDKDYEKTLPFLKNIVSMTSVDAYDHEHYREDQKLNEVALQALTAMFLEAKAEGISSLYSTSAYRTYTYQTSVFNRNVDKTNGYHCTSCGTDFIGKSNVCPVCGTASSTLREVTKAEKEANVATYSCRPGTSDHQSGLAVDIIQSSLPSRYWGLIQEFGETEAGEWLAANAHKFGFVLRFPADKEEITGIIYEPWHFRFVGRERATFMYENNLCLEEYVEYLEQTGYFES